MPKIKTHKAILEMVVFAMLGALLFASKIAFEALPNIHPVTMLIMVTAVVYRWKALIPVAVFVVLSGVTYGFAVWWLPYLYIWAVYALLTLLIPRTIPNKIAAFVYPVVCGLFGLMYGVLYAPSQALLYGYGFSTTVKWIVSGLPFDALHALGNLGLGLLILPLSLVLKRLKKTCEG